MATELEITEAAERLSGPYSDGYGDEQAATDGMLLADAYLAQSNERTPITEPVYVTLRNGKYDDTTELVPGLVMADYDSDDVLLGIEILNVVDGN